MSGQGETRETTFVFADIAGFTALTEAHGDEEAAELARRFCRRVTELIPEDAGEVVKTIGDAVMARLDDPAAAVQLGLQVAHMTEHGSPVVRVGIHCGPAVEREGDWFGATVNTAARVAGVASGGEVLVTSAVRRALGATHDVQFVDRGEHRLRNVALPVQLFRVLGNGRGPEAHPLDPVCRMLVQPGREAGVLRHEDVEYHFCSLVCAERFASDPGAYVTRPPGGGTQ